MFKAACTVDVRLDAEGRKTAPLTRDRKGERALLFSSGDDVLGCATVDVKPGKKVDHSGIKVELIGQVENLSDKSGTHDFLMISKDLSPPGQLSESRDFQFKFGSVDLSEETYCGTNVLLRYFVRVSVLQKRSSAFAKEVDMVVYNTQPVPEHSKPLKMEVGIEECLHLEFEYDKSDYHMRDVVVGKVYFLLVRIKIKHMELNIVRRESCTGAKGAQLTENETLTQFEIMDGSPLKDHCIPVRVYLTGFDLTPTCKNVQSKFSVKYFLNLVIVDEEERRYFKQHEVNFFRKKV